MAGWDSGLKPTSNPVEQAATNAMRGGLRLRLQDEDEEQATADSLREWKKEEQTQWKKEEQKKSQHNGYSNSDSVLDEGFEVG